MAPPVQSTGTICRVSVLPIAVLRVVLLLVTLFPTLVTWLPSLLAPGSRSSDLALQDGHKFWTVPSGNGVAGDSPLEK